MRQLAEFYGCSFLTIVLMDDESMFSQHSVKITLKFLKQTPGNKNVTFEVQRSQNPEPIIDMTGTLFYSCS